MGLEIMKYKVIILYVLAVVAMGCASKKKVYEKVTTKDSVSYVLPSENKLVIEELCDTLKIPVQVLKTIDSGASKTTVEVKNNRLTVTTKTDTIFKDRLVYRDRVKTEEIEVPYVPKWWKFLFWIVLSYAVVGTFFPKVSKAVNVMVKKLIGFPV